MQIAEYPFERSPHMLWFSSAVMLRRGMQLYTPQYLFLSNPTKPYDRGTQMNRLIETILLGTKNIGLEGQIRSFEHAKRPFI